MIKWSYSGIKQYINCPKQYNEVKVLKKFQTEVTEQMLYGTLVHEALEAYTRDKTPLPKNYERFQPLVDLLLTAPGTPHAELKLALTVDKKPCAFNAAEYWVRGIIDLLIIGGDTAYVVDYKTGSPKYADTKQLKLMALMVFAHYPEITTVRAGLLFVLREEFVTETYTRDKADTYWAEFGTHLAKLAFSHEHQSWPANPTGLCGWCPVTTCTFYKPKRKW